jgi:hypothetical protein
VLSTSYPLLLPTHSVQVVGDAHSGKTALVRTLAAYSENSAVDTSVSAGVPGVGIHVLQTVPRGRLRADEPHGMPQTAPFLTTLSPSPFLISVSDCCDTNLWVDCERMHASSQQNFQFTSPCNMRVM